MELKFRAFTKGEMIYGVQPDVSKDTLHCMYPDGSNMLIHEPDGSKSFWYSVSVDVIMQFTGLLDKKGKEIYEGDILKFDLTHAEGRFSISELKWYKFAWRLSGLWLLTEVHEIEVIGNIHQNPELLNAQTD